MIGGRKECREYSIQEGLASMDETPIRLPITAMNYGIEAE
jgi:hypothetical protein